MCNTIEMDDSPIDLFNEYLVRSEYKNAIEMWLREESIRNAGFEDLIVNVCGRYE
jgi:hypothetical protein